MQYHHKILLILVLSLVACTVMAAERATPFGVVLGKSTAKDVRAALGNKTHFQVIDQNPVSHGLSLISNGEGLDMPDLRKAIFAFDADGTLQYVQLTLPKGGMRNAGFKRFYGMLKSKYHPVKSSQPFVGDQYARFDAANAWIELDAPHMSFEMTVTYTTASMRAMLNRYEARTTQQRRSAQSGNL